MCVCVCVSQRVCVGVSTAEAKDIINERENPWLRHGATLPDVDITYSLLILFCLIARGPVWLFKINVTTACAWSRCNTLFIPSLLGIF